MRLFQVIISRYLFSTLIGNNIKRFFVVFFYFFVSVDGLIKVNFTNLKVVKDFFQISYVFVLVVLHKRW